MIRAVKFLLLLIMFTLSVKVNAASPGAGFLKGTIPYEWFTRVNSSNSGTTTPFINAFSGQVNMSKTNENVCSSCCSTGYGVYHGGFSSSDFKVDKTNYTYACKAHTYAVTYECGTGKGTAPSQGAATYDANFTPANNTCTAPTGYSFAGWSVSGTTSDVKAAGTPFVWQYAEDKTFTAKWSPKTYTVTYNCGTGTGTQPSQGTATYNANFTPASNTCTAPTGYSFAGWTVSGTSDVKTAGTAFKWTYTANKTFTAKWTANTINLSWDENGHGGTPPTEPATCVYGSTITMPVALTETGWIFNKWTVNEKEFDGATDVVCNETNLGVSANNATARIKAKWSPITYSIVFNGNAENVTGSTATMQGLLYDKSYELTANGFTKPGYKFDGWCDAWNTETSACAVDANNYSDKQVVSNLTTTNNDTITMYATWELTPYTIVYDTNGGSAVPDDSYNIIDTQPNGYNLATTSKTGYTFDGWCVYDSKQTSGNPTICKTPIRVLEAGTTGNKWAYARWTANTINLSWDKNGHGVLPEDRPLSCEYGSTITMPATLIETGWTFNNWGVHGNTFAGGESVGCNETNLGVSEDGATATVKADWTANTINLSWDKNGHGVLPENRPLSCEYGSTITMLATLIETGWTFNNWGVHGNTFTGGESVVCNEGSLGVSANGATATIKADWTANVYTITYNTNGGVISGNSNVNTKTPNEVYIQTYTVESSSIVLAQPAKEGAYVFAGWYENENFTGNAVSEIEPGGADGKYHRDISFYARWKKHCDAGYYLPANSEECAECTAGYYCKGGDYFTLWSETQGLESCSGKTQGNYKHSYSKQEDVSSCFAILKLNGNGGKTSDAETSYDFRAYNNVNENASSCLQYDTTTPMCVSPKEKQNFNYVLNTENARSLFLREGYDFDGWCSSSSVPCAEADKVSGTTKLKGDTSLYAQWKLKEYEIKYYDVFVSNEPKSRNAPDGYPTTYTIETVFNFGPLAQMTDNDGLVWEFGGWFSDENLTTGFSGISAGQMTGDKNVYAKWTAKTGSVNFICNPELKETKSGQVGSYIDVYTCGLDENIGWSCSGYPKFAENYTKVQVPDGTIDCHPGYRITYKGEGIGEGEQENLMIDVEPNVRLVPDTYTSDLEVVFPSKRFMNGYNLRPGYSFTGWFYNSNFTNATTGIARGSSGHKTVWARWMPNKYNVTYDCDSTNADSVTPESTSATYDVNFIVASDTCRKTGYTFDGWMVSKTDDIKQSDAAFKWTYAADKTFTAKWTANIYTFTLNKNADDATDVNMTTAVYEKYDTGWYTDSDATEIITANDNLVVAPTRDGYTFGGYYRCAQTTGYAGCERIIAKDGALVANVKTDIVADGTLYAKWVLTTICPAGQYYNGEIKECKPCEEGYYCEGVTHLMGNNDNQNDGINKCPTRYPRSDSGNSDIGECYMTMSFYAGKDATFSKDPSAGDALRGPEYWVSDSTDYLVIRKYKKDTSYFDYVSDTDGVHTLKHSLLINGTDAPTKPGHEFLGWLWQNSNVEPSECRAQGMKPQCTKSNPANCDDALKRGCELGNLKKCPTNWSYVGGLCIPDNKLTLVNEDTEIRSGKQRNFYAKWGLEEYNITYYVYDFDGTRWQDMDLTPDKYNITSGKITFATPESQNGYLFKGWCVDDEYPNQDCITIDKEFTPTAGNLGNIKLYAKWVETPTYNITYVLNGGSGAETGTYQSGIGLLLPTPTRADWTFTGWYRNGDLSGDIVESILNTESGDVTLYANWEFNCESGKWLHVGANENDKMCLSDTKPAGKALAVMVGDAPYYVYLSESGNNSKNISSTSNKKLHVLIGGTVYNAHDASVE